ncbi:hypothetical protein Bca52824_010940 [Brassica carinata]|uniref:Prohibitin n=1 Tax=Brassica carinata TaxID=52824 RepID=A0A8X8BBQ7_BRACI|nr:hypothetical protein Bca52824_010940 [Brassica carinata]
MFSLLPKFQSFSVEIHGHLYTKVSSFPGFSIHISDFSLCFIDLKEMSFNKVPNVPGSPALSALLKVSVIGGLCVYAVANSLYNVEGRHRAVMFNRLTGLPGRTHFMLPWFERPIIYDVTSGNLAEHNGGENSNIGMWMGWAMAFIYMGGRLPRIFLNIRRGHVEGLNPLRFFFALVGNMTYDDVQA